MLDDGGYGSKAEASARPYPVPPDEARRLELLSTLDLFGTAPELEYDQLTKLAADLLGFPICLVTLMGDGDQWFKSHWGTEVECVPREVSFCNHTILRDALFVVEDATLDERFRDNPTVAGPPHIRFYAGAPLFAGDRVALGALCLLDVRPRTLDDAQRALLLRLAAIVSERIERRREQRLATQAAASALEYVESGRATLLARTARDEQVRTQVDAIVTGIDRLAGHLRILALNASIDAAHAGDVGHGFSIIACEVRKLAEDARSATARARTLLA